MLETTPRLFKSASDYELKQICPNILAYSDRYNNFNTLFDYNKSALYKNTPDIFHSYLTYCILINFLNVKTAVKLELEKYYMSNMTGYLQKENKFVDFKLANLAKSWLNIENQIDYITEYFKTFDSMSQPIQIPFTDAIYNYTYQLPSILIKNNIYTLYLILPYTSEIPSYYNYLTIARTIAYLKTINLIPSYLHITWIDTSNILTKFTNKNYKILDSYFEYANILHDTSNYTRSDIQNLPRLNNCLQCPYTENCSQNRFQKLNFKTPK
jgi:hypothetical protein